jgi:hypothetical protein
MRGDGKSMETRRHHGEEAPAGRGLSIRAECPANIADSVAICSFRRRGRQLTLRRRTPSTWTARPGCPGEILSRACPDRRRGGRLTLTSARPKVNLLSMYEGGAI